MLDATAPDFSSDRPARPTQDLSPSIPLELREPECTVHPFVFCPPFPCGTRYSLVVRKPWGQRIVLARGVAKSRHPSVNLARVRHEGAKLGVTEVHLVPAC